MRILVRAMVVALFVLAAEPVPALPQAPPPTAEVAAPSQTHGAVPAGTKALTPPPDLTDVSAWVAYKQRSEREALHDEARLFYRRGLQSRRAGHADEAIRLVQGAAELDPNFAAPHQTLISWFLFREPGQALVHCAALLELLRHNFLFQLDLAANAATLGIEAVLLALLAAGLILVVTRHRDLRHGPQERLTPLLGAQAARKWPWVFLAVPYLIGLGVALPTVFFLGLLWPILKLRERAVFVLLAVFLGAAPWIAAGMNRLAEPLSDQSPPWYGVTRLESRVPSKTELSRLTMLAQEHEDQPFLQFGLGWAQRQAENLPAAEEAYRRAIAIWPDDDRALNNLGNVLAMRGDLSQALETYQMATAANPNNAAAYFNLAQAHTRRFDFHAANEALSRASGLDFEMVRSHQAQTTEDRPMPLVDQWIGPGHFWTALLETPASGSGPPVVPPAWRNHLEFSGWNFSVVAVLCALLGLILGIVQHRTLPLRRCGNCDQVVCRRCAERRREVALCRSCATVEARAKAPDFARVLLAEHRRKLHRIGRLVRTALAMLIPGFGLLALRRVVTPLLLLVASAALACSQLHAAAPFSYQAHLDLPGPSLSLVFDLVPWAVIYALSITGYLTEQARQDAKAAASARAPRRSGPAVRHVPAAAA